jgi:hypothetical protein
MPLSAPDDPIAVLQRWADAGAIWRVLDRTDTSVTITLHQCDGGEEVDRLTSADPRLLEYVTGRTSSDE